MFKFLVCASLVAVTLAGVIHDHQEHHGGGGDGESETEHHSHVDHKHAQSHQSIKFIHYHAVPVYVKKEDQKYLKHPVEIGSNKYKLKVVHPETEHAKSYGLTLENHSEFKNHKILAHDNHYHQEKPIHEVHEIQEEEPHHEYDFAAYEAEHH